MAGTKIIQFKIDEKLYREIIDRANDKGFLDYAEYIRELCIQDINIDLEALDKLSRILEILSS